MILRDSSLNIRIIESKSGYFVIQEIKKLYWSHSHESMSVALVYLFAALQCFNETSKVDCVSRIDHVFAQSTTPSAVEKVVRVDILRAM